MKKLIVTPEWKLIFSNQPTNISIGNYQLLNAIVA